MQSARSRSRDLRQVRLSPEVMTLFRAYFKYVIVTMVEEEQKQIHILVKGIEFQN